MSTAADQIAAPAAAKKPRAKPAAKTCGFHNCTSAVAAGSKLRLTVLEVASLYPAAVDGKVATCKSHRMCVGFYGLSPEHAQGTPLFPQCGTPAKVLYLGQSFCEACHNVYLEALCAQIKPRLTVEQIDVVRTQVVKDNYKKPEADPVSAEMAELTAKLDALKAKQAGKPKAKAAAPAAPKKTAPPAPKKTPAPKASDVSASDAEGDDQGSSGSETETVEAAEPPPRAKAPPKVTPKAVAAAAPAPEVVAPVEPVPAPMVIPNPDAFEAEELTKEERALAALSSTAAPKPKAKTGTKA